MTVLISIVLKSYVMYDIMYVYYNKNRGIILHIVHDVYYLVFCFNLSI